MPHTVQDKSSPRITVLMPVYNGEAYLAEAVQSILDQTFRDFELLILDDGSTDKSPAILASLQDSRIRWVSNGTNLGLVATLNKGLKLATGEYVARMDCDDISFPERLEKQITFMDQNPEIGLCGTWFERQRTHTVEWAQPATDDAEIRFWLLFKTVFLHSSVMMRRSCFVKYALDYSDEYPHAEDYALWIRCSRYMKLANIPLFLLTYRYHPENTSSRHSVIQQTQADQIARTYLTRLDESITTEDLNTHFELLRFRTPCGLDAVQKSGAWLLKLADLVENRLKQPGGRVYQHFEAQWYAVCGKAAKAGLSVWYIYLQHPAGRRASLVLKCKLFLRCFLRRDIAG